MHSIKDIIGRAGKKMQKSFLFQFRVILIEFFLSFFQCTRSTANANNVRDATATANGDATTESTTVSDLCHRHANESSESTEWRTAYLRSIVHINSKLAE
jgi:hypothetical protein